MPPTLLRPRLLTESLAQRDIALLLLAPVAATGDGAVHHQIVTVDEAGLVTGQKYRGVGDVLGQAGARDRLCGLVDLAHQRRRLFGRIDRQAQRLADNACRDRARRDRIDANPGFAKLHGDAFGKVNHRRLRRAIDHRGRKTGEPPRDAAIVDDAAEPLLLHMRRGVLHAEHDAANQHRHRGVEALDLKALDAAGLCGPAGIVEQAIDLAELFDRKRDQRAHLIFDRDVGLVENAVRTELFRQRLTLGHAAAGDDDFRTLSHEDLRRTQADAAGGARDHRDLAVEPSHVVSSSSCVLASYTMIGTRPAGSGSAAAPGIGTNIWLSCKLHLQRGNAYFPTAGPYFGLSDGAPVDP